MSKKDKWVRELSRQYGIEDERIDYDQKSGYITLDGVKTVKPDYVTEGKSYVQDSSALEKIFKEDEKRRVAVADYAAGKPTPISLSYGDAEGVTLGGKKVSGIDIKDGKAYTTKGAVDALTEDKSQKAIVDEAEERYGKAIDNILKEVSGRKFSYNPETDEAFLAYKKQFEEAGEKAVADVLAKYSESTGGVPNSMAVTAAAGASGEYKKALTDKIPQLYEAAFERFLQENVSDLKTAEAYKEAMSGLVDLKGTALARDNDEIRKNISYVENRYADEAEKNLAKEELELKKETEKNDREREERKLSLAEQQFDYDKIQNDEKITDTRKKELLNAVSDAYNFIQKAFVSEETGVNKNGIRLYVDSLQDVLPKDIREAILRTYGA